MESCRDLDIAIRQGNAQRVREILQQNNVNLRAPENDDLLWMAIRKGNTKIMEMLIRAGADLNVKDPLDYENRNHNWSILHELLDLGEEGKDHEEYRRLALLAIEHGADVQVIESVFQTSYVTSSAELMRALISRGVDVGNEADIIDCLETAAYEENAAEMFPLIFSLNDPSTADVSRRAVIANVYHLGSEFYSLSVFEENLKLVVDVDEHSYGDSTVGDTMLTRAAFLGNVDAVMALLNRGANINGKNEVGQLPLYAAATSNNSVIMKLLISRGASIHARNDDGKYPIHGACASKIVANLHFLLSQGASVNVTDYKGKYPIHIACSKNRGEVIHFLLSLGTPINVIDIKGNTPFSRLDCRSLHRTTYLCIKHFVLLDVTTGALTESDLKIVEANPQMSELYENCYNELRSMSQTVIFEDFDLLTLFVTSTSKLSMYWRNTEFAVAMEECLKQQSDRFSMYFKQLEITLLVARKKREFIEHMENILAQSFPIMLPYLVIEKITRYIVSEELTRLELNFYLSQYKQAVPSD